MKKHEKSGGLIYRRCLPLCVISPSAVIARPALFDAIGVFDESLPACEDYDLWLRVTARYPVLFVDERLTVKHGGHDDQLSRRYWGMDRFRVRALEKMLASEELTEANREATRAMLTQKLRILSAGARKRGNADWARGFEAQLELVSKESST
jgi:GT2 family glycosyltransferase